MELQLKITGVLLMVLALFHAGFPIYFKWKDELKSLSLINRQIFKVHTFFIGLVVFLIGLLCFNCSGELLSTILGKKICLGLGVFWLIRLYFQIFVYSSNLWKGKKFETTIHFVFTGFWIYLCWLFFKIGL